MSLISELNKIYNDAAQPLQRGSIFPSTITNRVGRFIGIRTEVDPLIDPAMTSPMQSDNSQPQIDPDDSRPVSSHKSGQVIDPEQTPPQTVAYSVPQQGPSEAFLREISQLSEVEWNVDYLWDCKFAQTFTQGLPEYFVNWLPVVDIDENLATAVNETQELATTSASIPKGTSEFDLQITFMDDDKNSLLKFFANWINVRIQGGGSYLTSTLEDSYKEIWIRKLTREKVEVETRSYLVIPEGGLNFAGKSTSDASLYNMTLKIVGTP